MARRSEDEPAVADRDPYGHAYELAPVDRNPGRRPAAGPRSLSRREIL
jgi:hypothetical protein